MKIVDLFRRLSFGELSNLALSNGANGTIKEERQPQIIQYANEGLLNLHSRFILSEKDLLIEMKTGITNYHLRPEYAESSESNVSFAYIKDLESDPYQGDLIKILQVLDLAGYVHPLNDIGNPASFFTPQPNILQVPEPIDGMPLSVVYQATHYNLKDNGNFLEQEIDLPIFLEIALQKYIGYKVYCDMNGPENVAKGQEYLAAYESTCVDVESRDLVNQTYQTTTDKFEQRGFV